MDSGQFDELTRALVNSTSRRQTIGLLFAGILGGALGFGGIGAAQASENLRMPASVRCSPGCGKTSDTDSLWKAVQACQMNAKACFAVDPSHPAGKYQWVLKHEKEANNYTLIAGERRTGIECSDIWEHTNPNYWDFAYQAAKKNLSSKLDVGMAINSKSTRDFCQLHIHVSCIRSDVLKTLQNKKDIPTTPSAWTSTKALVKDLPILPTPHRDKADFRVIRLSLSSEFTYGGKNLFQLLYEYVIKDQKRPADDMALQTLVVVPVPGTKDEFYIINSEDVGSKYLRAGEGAGERLLNEQC